MGFDAGLVAIIFIFTEKDGIIVSVGIIALKVAIMKNSLNLGCKGLIALLLLLLAGLSWWSVSETELPRPARAADNYEAMLDRLHPLGIPQAEIVRCTDPRAKVQCRNGICTTSTDPQACLFYGGVAGPVTFTATVTATVTITPETPAADGTPTPVGAPTPAVPTPVVTPIPVPGANNLISNGNFEFGFYQVHQLGFEIPDVGNVPKDWGWYRNPAYGKYTITSNQTLGLECADDLTPETIELIRQQQAAANEGFGPIPGFSPPPPNNAASFQIQSSDQQDARIGIYQVVNVVPGRTYRLTMSGTIQIQEGAGTLQPTDPEAPREAQNHTVELFFDYRGGTDWKAIPQQEKIILPWKESEALFQEPEEDDDDTRDLITEEDPDEGLSRIEDFEVLVTARSSKLTIFIGSWRKWANWRSGYVTVDCVSLTPASGSGGGRVAPGGQPAAAGESGAGLPVTGSQTIPNYIITGQGLKESPRFGKIIR